MVMQESGHALVSWAQFDGWIESIVALEYDPTTAWGQTELIELNMAAGSRNPVIGTDIATTDYSPPGNNIPTSAIRRRRRSP